MLGGQLCRAIRGSDGCCHDNIRAGRHQEAPQVRQRGTVSHDVVTDQALPSRDSSSKHWLILQPILRADVGVIHLIDLANIQPELRSNGFGQNCAERTLRD